jgi:membrane protease YdiL (CAAX protease family)
MFNGYLKLGFALLLVLAIAIAFQVVGGGLVAVYTSIKGVGLFQASAKLQLVMNGVAQIVVMIGLPLLLAKILKQRFVTIFRLEGIRSTPAIAYVLAVPIIFVSQFLGQGFVTLWEKVLMRMPALYQTVKSFEKLVEELTKGLASSAKTIPDLLLLILLIAVIPAIAEEMTFRGFTQTNIERSGQIKPRPIAAIFWTSLAFAIFHLELIELPGLFILGATLGYLSYRTNNLLVGSVAHAANNGAIVILLFLIPDVEHSKQASTLIGSGSFTTLEGLLIIALTLPLFLGMMYLFHRVTEAIPERENPMLERTQLEEPLLVLSVADLSHPSDNIIY